MKCPFCDVIIGDWVTFCTSCGKKLPEIIKEEIKKNIESELKEFQTPEIGGNLFAPYQKNEISMDIKETSQEADIDKKHQRDLAGMDIILEINENKSYQVGEINNFEFRVKNCSTDHLEKLDISSYLINLCKQERNSIRRIKSSQQEIVYLPFDPTKHGMEIVKVSLQYVDSKGNPSFYETQFEIRVFNKEEGKGRSSITNVYKGEKIIGVRTESKIDGERKEEKRKKSFSNESERVWRQLYLHFDEEGTEDLRREIFIKKKMAEGEECFWEGENQRQNGERLFYKDKKAAREALIKAFDCFKEGEDRFKKVREIDPEHAASLDNIKKIKGICSEIEGKIGTLGKEPATPKSRLTSGCLTLGDPQKEIFLYSKNRITLGRDTKNDIKLRLIPYQWKQEYGEEVGKMLKQNPQDIPDSYFPQKTNKKYLISSTMISSMHAEIINKIGNFYIRDIGSTNGTFVEGKRLKPHEEHLLKDDTRINIAGVLDLELRFFGEFKKAREKGSSFDSCFTVLGEKSDSCFGIDKKGVINAIKITRLNNYPEGEEYIILVREVTIGSSRTNAIVIEGERVSDIHAKIFYRNEQYWIEDLNSRYGTKVNNDEIDPLVEVPLGEGAEITIGDINLRFEGVV